MSNQKLVDAYDLVIAEAQNLIYEAENNPDSTVPQDIAERLPEVIEVLKEERDLVPNLDIGAKVALLEYGNAFVVMLPPGTVGQIAGYNWCNDYIVQHALVQTICTDDDLIEISDASLEALWQEFGDIAIGGWDEENQVETDDIGPEDIDQDFLWWKRGTFREDIWRWFDQHHSKGVAWLMYGDEALGGE